MLDCPASDLSGTGLKKINNDGTGPVPHSADTVRHFLVRYPTKLRDAGMLMPALVSSMPMPSYAFKPKYVAYPF
jgi:hypothetical protein